MLHSPTRDTIASAIALGLHVGAWAAISSRPSAHRLIERQPTASREIALVDDEPTQPAAPALASAAHVDSSSGSSVPPRGERPSAPRPAAGEGTEPSASPSAPPGWTFSPFVPGASTALAPFVPPAPWAWTAPELAPPKEEGSAPARRSVLADVDAHDRSLGLGPNGPLVAATREAARTSLVPIDSKGRVVATFAADGSVVDVTVEGTGDAFAWKDLGKEILSAMKQKKLRIPGSAKGLRIELAVISRLRSAAAHDKGSHLRFGPDKEECPGCLVSGPFDPTDALLDATSKKVRTVDVVVESVDRL